MQPYKLGFRNRTAPEQLAICERAVRGFATLPEEQRNLPKFTNAAATVAAARTAHDQIASLRAELKTAVTQRNTLLRAAREQVTQASSSLSHHFQRDPAKLLSAGLELASQNRRPAPDCPAPGNFRAQADALEGVVKMRWEHPLRGRVFEIQYRLDSSEEKDWQHCLSCVKRSGQVKGLTPGAKYWFRVRVVNGDNKSAWSNPVAVRVR